MVEWHLDHHISVGARVIDEDYRGNVGVLLFNLSDTPFIVNRGDKIAQLICKKILPRIRVGRTTG
jgi:dUTP pyrophosphatase